MKQVKKQIWKLSDEASLSTAEKDEKVITTIVVSEMGPVRNMIWLLFSLFPAAIAAMIIFLTYFKCQKQKRYNQYHFLVKIYMPY